jgi:Family of unknown function (DUF6311)
VAIQQESLAWKHSALSSVRLSITTDVHGVSTREIVAAALAGFAAFWYSVGLRVLDVTNVRWLLVGDSAQAYLGWEFFRKTPLLQWPLGENPSFGVGFSSTIVFADGIPLVSIVLKPIVAWYDGVFQFHGWWMLVAFVLQAVLTVKILEQLGVTRVVRLLSLPLLLLQPAFLDRMRFDGYGHMALSAHWLMLLGIWLFLRDTTSHRHWTAALVVAMGVTIYYFVILGVFYVAWIALRLWGATNRRLAWRDHTSRLTVTAIGILAFAWAIGGLASSSLQDSGLGIYRASLVSLVDAATLNGTSWSRFSFVPDVTNLQGSQEGFAFMGVAALAMLLISVARVRAWIRLALAPKSVMLMVLTAIFFALSLSPRIGAGPREVASYEWPVAIEHLLSVIRSSGRLMWLPMYLLTFFSIAMFTRHRQLPGKRIPTWLTLVGLVGFGAVHLVDTSAGVADVRSRFVSTAPVFVTDDPQWDEWASGKRHLVAIPPLSNDPRWIDLAVLANRHRLTTNAAYVSRKDEREFARLVVSSQMVLEARMFREDTLYVITNYPPNPEARRVLVEGNASSSSTWKSHQVEELTVVVP